MLTEYCIHVNVRRLCSYWWKLSPFPPATLLSDIKHNYQTISRGKRQTLILPSAIARLIAVAIDTRPL